MQLQPEDVALAIINPGSGSAEPEALEAQLAERLTGRLVLHRVADGEDIAERTASLIEAHDPKLVIACGGDGTISAVASVLLGTGRPLAIVPVGTANVLARELGVSREPAEALDVVRHGEVRPVDAMQMGQHVCLCRIAFGLFSEVGKESTSDAKRRFAMLAYVWNGLQAFSRANSTFRFVLEVDGEVHRVRGSSVLVVNAAQLGFADLRFSDEIRVDDGAVDILVVHGHRLLDYGRLLLSMALRRPDRPRRDVTRLRARQKLVVRGRPLVTAVADGEPVRRAKYEVTIHPAGLHVLGPAPQPQDLASAPAHAAS